MSNPSEINNRLTAIFSMNIFYIKIFNKPINSEYMDIKDNLYSVLNQFGKENLQIEFQNDIASSISKIKEILDKTIETIYEKTPNEKNIDNCNKFQKPLSSLCEAFLHFLLTSSSLPSQRRIKLKDLEIDLVIPDIKTFFQDPR